MTRRGRSPDESGSLGKAWRPPPTPVPRSSSSELSTVRSPAAECPASSTTGTDALLVDANRSCASSGQAAVAVERSRALLLGRVKDRIAIASPQRQQRRLVFGTFTGHAEAGAGGRAARGMRRRFRAWSHVEATARRPRVPGPTRSGAARAAAATSRLRRRGGVGRCRPLRGPSLARRYSSRLTIRIQTSPTRRAKKPTGVRRTMPSTTVTQPSQTGRILIRTASTPTRKKSA
jgi:hypothetical protein